MRGFISDGDWAVVLTYLRRDRSQVGHWEIDTVLGSGKPCIVTLVERKTGYVMIGKLGARTVAELNRAAIHLITSAPLPVYTITADNGTEFHGYKHIEAATSARFYFATPHHSWERGTNENTNGLIRQYLPKRCRHEERHPVSLQPYRRHPQPPAPQTPRLPHPSGVL